MIKIFLTDQIGIGITKKGEIYTEVMGNQRDEVVSVLYDVKAHNLKACKFKKSEPSTKEPLVKGGQCPAFLMIPYMVLQRVQDKYKELVFFGGIQAKRAQQHHSSFVWKERMI